MRKKRSQITDCTDKIGQHSDSVVPQQTRRSLSLSLDNGRTFSPLVQEETFPNSSSLSPGKTQHTSRSTLQENTRSLRLEVEPQHFPEAPTGLGENVNRSVCFQVESSTSPLLLPSTRPQGNSDRCLHSGLEQRSTICQPSNSPLDTDTTEDSPGESRSNHHRSLVANTTMVSSLTAPSHLRTVHPTQVGLDISTRETLAASGAQHKMDLRRLEDIRRSSRAKDLSPTALALIMNSWRTSTSKNYNSAWKLWAEYAEDNEIDPLQPTSQEVANYLAALFLEGKSSASIANARSAISQTVDAKTPLGESWPVRMVMRGIQASVPLHPKYSTIWI